MYAHYDHPKMMVVDKKLGWRHVPNESKVFVNEDGEACLILQNEFRNRGPAHPLERVPNKYRILVLGDSFTEGVHVGEADLFSALLEASGDDLEVINTGVGAWGTVQQFLYLRDEGLCFAPDHIVLMFYENDLDDNVLPYAPRISSRPHARLEGEEVRLIENCDDESYLQYVVPIPGRAFLLERSYLFYAFNDRVWFPRNRDALLKIEKADRNAIGRDAKLRVFFDVLARIKTVAEEAGAHLNLVLIPTSSGVAEGDSEIHERILSRTEAMGIETRSLLPPLKEALDDGRSPYFDVDIHWNRTGHRVVADTLIEQVRRRRRL